MSRALALAFLSLVTGVACGSSTTTTGYSATAYTVTPAHDSYTTVTPAGVQATAVGGVQTFAVTAAAGYTVSSTVGGTCPSGTWAGSSYTTGSIIANCTVVFSSTSLTGDPNSGSTGTPTFAVAISSPHIATVPSGTVQVVKDGTVSVSPTVNTGYTLTQNVTGSCPAGTWDAGIYTTGAITAACSLDFAANAIPYYVNPFNLRTDSTPSNTYTASYGEAVTFAVAAPSYCAVAQNVTGSCPAGSWSGGNYTTGPITASCSVDFSCTDQYVQISPVNGNTTVTPGGPQAVLLGGNQTFAVTAQSGYTLDTNVSGTCAAGTWNGNNYKTGPANANCTVGFDAFATVITGFGHATDGNVTVSPASASTVSGGNVIFYVTPATGYKLWGSGWDCPYGTHSQWLNSNTFQAGPMTQNCNFTFSSQVATPQVPYLPQLTTTAITQSGGNAVVSLSWGAATDQGTPANDLNYTLCASGAYPLYNSFSSIVQVLGSNNCVHVTGATQANITVSPNAIYIFNVVVSDVLNQQAVYQPKGEHTSSALIDYIQFTGNTNDTLGNLNLAPATNASITTTVGTLSTDRYGNSNSAYNFSGSGNQCVASINNVAGTATGPNPHTLTFWLKTGIISGAVSPISIGGDGATTLANGSRFGLYGASSTWYEWFFGEDVTLTAPETQLSDWQFWVLTYAGTGTGGPNSATATAYVNGVSVGHTQTWSTPPSTNDGPLFVGCAINGPVGTVGGPTNYYMGAIDDIRLYDGVLCDGTGSNGCASMTNEVLDLYNATRP